jgi:choline monooxygenase
MSIFRELADHAALPFESARMLPLETYRSDDVLAIERSRIFRSGWICVGRTADLLNTGDYLTAEVPIGRSDEVISPSDDISAEHRSVIVLRGEDGEVAAFDNVCVHRGARLLDGCGTHARLTCPYHAWVYRLDGQLIGGPYMTQTPDFDPTQHRLVGLRTEVWEGFIYVNQDPTAESLAPRLTGLTDVVSSFNMAAYVPVHSQVDVWATNWKLLVENFMDAYHIFKVHKGTFAKHGDNTLDTKMFPGTNDWAHHRVVHEGGADICPADNTSLVGDMRKAVVLAAVFPSHVMQLQGDWLWYLQITPLGTDCCRIRWDVSVAPEMLAAQQDPAAYIASILNLLNALNAEDQPIVEGLRRSVESPQFPRAPLSYLERNVYDFDHYIATRLSSQVVASSAT